MAPGNAAVDTRGLDELDLSSCNVGDVGAEAIALGKRVQVMHVSNDLGR